MAEWLGNTVVPGGSGCRIRIETQLASQNVGGNYSVINYQVYIDFFGCDAQLDGGYVAWNGGVLYNNGGRVYNYAGNFSNHTVTMATGSFTVGHDANGNASYSMNAHVAVYQTGTTSASGSEGLPRLALAPSIAYNGADTIKPTTARLYTEINNYGHGTSAATHMLYRLQGVGGYTQTGDAGDVAGPNYFNISGLKPGKTYEYYSVWWNNNGDTATSGVQTFKTQPISGMVAVMKALL